MGDSHQDFSRHALRSAGQAISLICMVQIPDDKAYLVLKTGETVALENSFCRLAVISGMSSSEATCAIVGVREQSVKTVGRTRYSGIAGVDVLTKDVVVVGTQNGLVD